MRAGNLPATKRTGTSLGAQLTDHDAGQGRPVGCEPRQIFVPELAERQVGRRSLPTSAPTLTDHASQSAQTM